ncbi:MAG: PEPxxWA-CTERM sorting domain-containing protein [Phenylobacterium sp.]
MSKWLLAFAGATALLAAQTANAAVVNATLSIDYFKVASGTDSDFPGGFPTVAAGSHLGVNGLPVGTGVADLVGGDNEIGWWSPALNAHVIADGSGTVSLPFAQNMYAPHGTGTDDTNFFQTAVLRGAFSLGSPGVVSFNLGSDDDSFLYIDGTLIGQNPGIHGVTNVNFASGTLGAGSHDVTLFYADRQHTGAFLSLNLNSTDVVITPPTRGGVPEPATWALMIIGFGVTGAALRRRPASVPA